MQNRLYRNVLTEIISKTKTEIIPGKTILVIWKNEDQMKKWVAGTESPIDAGVNIETLSTSEFPLLNQGKNNSKNINPDSVTVVALCYGLPSDYGNLKIMHYYVI